MATLNQDSTSGRIRFWYGGKQFMQSLKTHDRPEAEGVRTHVEETIRLLERGRLQMPPHADAGAFILSDGKLNGKPELAEQWTLKELFENYQSQLPAGAKAESTLLIERVHIKHFLRNLGEKTVVQNLSAADCRVTWQSVRRKSGPEGLLVRRRSKRNWRRFA